jgi:2Fe-2S ferredoxin
MPKVNFIQPDGMTQVIDMPVGYPVMEAAVKNGIRGIDADCGGGCGCATCHVYVAPDWLEKLAPCENVEAEMLEFAVEPAPNSRLSCQLKVTEDIDGLVVRVPKTQR